MNIRERSEEREYGFWRQYAKKSGSGTRTGNCPLRTEYQRDRDRILHSKAFRRLKHKTQVYIAPTDHYRTRMTHTLEVSQIARTVARALRLNEDLVEAIALGHDVGIRPSVMSASSLCAICSAVFITTSKSLRSTVRVGTERTVI